MHVGFWADAVEKEIQSALLRFSGLLRSFRLSARCSRFFWHIGLSGPIVGLTEVADKVTKGDLETSVVENA